MTQENKSGKDLVPSFAEVATSDATTMKFNKDVVNYATAEGDVKVKMDELIAKIDMGDINSITTFGRDPAEALGKSSELIVQRAQSSASFLGGFTEFKDKLKTFDFAAIGEMAKNFAEDVKRRTELAMLKGPKRWLKVVGNAVSGHKETKVEELRHAIDQSLLEFGGVIAGLKKARDQIPGVQTDLMTLGNARLEAYSDFGLYIGAALEKLRRSKGEIPALEVAAEDSPAKQQELNHMRLAYTVLNTKITDMDTFHKTSLIQLKNISDLETALSMTQLGIDGHLQTSQEQWKALLAEAATAAAVGEIAEAKRAADNFGDKIFEQAQLLVGVTTEMARESFGHGSVDPAKVIAQLEKSAASLQEGFRFVEEHNQKMIDQREAMDAAGRDFRAAATKLLETPKVTAQGTLPPSAPNAAK